MPEHSNDSNCKPKKKNILLRIREHEFNVIADKTPRDPVRSAFYPQKKNQMGSDKTSPRTNPGFLMLLKLSGLYLGVLLLNHFL